MTVKQLWGGILFALVVIVASNSLYVVKETQRGVLLKFGEVVNPNLQPGIHVKVPFVNNVRLFDGRILTVDSPAERFFTQEKKALIVDSYAKFRVLDTAKYYTATNGEEARAAGLLAQRINDGLRNEVAVRTVQEVVSGSRDEVMESITQRLSEVAATELGVEVIDVRVKKIDLPPDVSNSVYRRMNAEREKEARELRSEGQELAEGIRASADREVTVLEANAFREAEMVRGLGDAEATRIYADAYNQDPEFYAFVRSLKAYQETFNAGSDIMVIDPDNQFYQYLRSQNAGSKSGK
ncbi:MAG: protease modulator HflC [Halieaceae bacterium]|jgi:membrane protease subunit HflC|nr:protease modulator HflC [Halieaceae bacterium]MBT4854459.1 protease modulator HflC [Halieaceae bacterium]MBT7339803.1 protease modulator HflC [Halieaceae bacterium]MDG1829523.1 protease modulator HflC [Luminiphilus sp.]